MQQTDLALFFHIIFQIFSLCNLVLKADTYKIYKYLAGGSSD